MTSDRWNATLPSSTNRSGLTNTHLNTMPQSSATRRVLSVRNLRIPVTTADENPLLYRSGSAGEQSGGARKVSYRAARSEFERAATSACVGKQFRLLRLSGIDRLDVLETAAGAGR